MAEYVKYVEGVQRKYNGEWVNVRGVDCVLFPVGKKAKLQGVVEGVSESGYGKINTHRYEEVDEDVCIRVQENGVWVVLGKRKIQETAKVVYREIDVAMKLGFKRYLEGVEFELEGARNTLEEGLYVRERTKVKVTSIEGFWGMVENEVYVQDSGSFGSGVYIDPSISLVGVSALDLRCLGTNAVYISKKQESEIDWMEVVPDLELGVYYKEGAHYYMSETFVYVNGSEWCYEISIYDYEVTVKKYRIMYGNEE